MTRAPAGLRSAPGPAALHPPSARLRPRSYDLTAELPGLLAGLPHHWGRISSVLVNGTVWSLPWDGMLVADRMVHLRRTDSPRAEHTVCLLAPGHGVQSVAGWRASRRCSTRCVRGVQSPMGVSARSRMERRAATHSHLLRRSCSGRIRTRDTRIRSGIRSFPGGAWRCRAGCRQLTPRSRVAVGRRGRSGRCRGWVRYRLRRGRRSGITAFRARRAGPDRPILCSRFGDVLVRRSVSSAGKGDRAHQK